MHSLAMPPIEPVEDLGRLRPGLPRGVRVAGSLSRVAEMVEDQSRVQLVADGIEELVRLAEALHRRDKVAGLMLNEAEAVQRIGLPVSIGRPGQGVNGLRTVNKRPSYWPSCAWNHPTPLSARPAFA